MITQSTSIWCAWLVWTKGCSLRPSLSLILSTSCCSSSSKANPTARLHFQVSSPGWGPWVESSQKFSRAWFWQVLWAVGGAWVTVIMLSLSYASTCAYQTLPPWFISCQKPNGWSHMVLYSEASKHELTKPLFTSPVIGLCIWALGAGWLFGGGYGTCRRQSLAEGSVQLQKLRVYSLRPLPVHSLLPSCGRDVLFASCSGNPLARWSLPFSIMISLDLQTNINSFFHNLIKVIVRICGAKRSN